MLAPALRLGAIAAPVSLLPQLAAAKGGSDLVCSSLLQIALATYLRTGHFDGHLRAARGVYRERADVMLAAIDRYMPGCVATRPDGGMSLWLRLPHEIEEARFTADALQAGVAIVPGRAFFAERASQPAMRLTFAMQSPERIERGIEILGSVLTMHRASRHRPISLARAASGPLV